MIVEFQNEMFKSYKALIFMMFWALATISCNFNFLGPVPQTPPPPPNPQSLPSLGLFNDPDCWIGCWNGLEPGKTTRQTLDTLYPVNSEDQYGLVQHSLSPGFAYSMDGVLLAIIFPKGNLPLDIIVEELGDPDYMDLLYVSATQLTLTMIYEEGYMFFFSEIDGLRGRPVTDTNIQVCLNGSFTPRITVILEPANPLDLIRRIEETSLLHVISGNKPRSATTTNVSWNAERCIDVSTQP